MTLWSPTTYHIQTAMSCHGQGKCLPVLIKFFHFVLKCYLISKTITCFWSTLHNIQKWTAPHFVSTVTINVTPLPWPVECFTPSMVIITLYIPHLLYEWVMSRIPRLWQRLVCDITTQKTKRKSRLTVHLLLQYKEYTFNVRKENNSLLMNQGMTDEKLLPDFHVYVKDRDGSIRR